VNAHDVVGFLIPAITLGVVSHELVVRALVAIASPGRSILVATTLIAPSLGRTLSAAVGTTARTSIILGRAVSQDVARLTAVVAVVGRVVSLAF
jgi:hypothetical protein